MDTLPSILDNMADSISAASKTGILAPDTTLAQEHGGERARLSDFDLTALLNELIILREIIIRTLKKHNLSDEESVYFLNKYLDTCIQSSATAFSLIQADLREKLMVTLSHDMRTPLHAASLAAHIILKASKDPKIIKQAENIKRHHRRIDSMIQDLLNITLLKSGGRLNPILEEISASQIVNEIKDDFGPAITKRIKCNENTINGIWDKNLLKRALENLISNALKYGNKESDITIDIKAEHERVRFDIHNHGPAIPKEEQEVIFQIFRRAELSKLKEKPGWGLGLPIVRAVAEAHGGSISVRSLQDSGTNFVIDIPQDSRPYLHSPQSEEVGD